MAASEEWVPLRWNNTNAEPDVDMPSLAMRRGIRAAATMVTVRRVMCPREVTIETAIGVGDFDASGRVPLAVRARDWFPTAPA